jgi:hypothetical protein
MDPRQIDLTEVLLAAREGLAGARPRVQPRRQPPMRRPPRHVFRRTGRAVGVVVLLLCVTGTAFAFKATQRRNVSPLSSASDTSRMVRVDGSTVGSGRFFLTSVRRPPLPGVQVATTRERMETSKRNAVRVALACVGARRGVSIDAGRLAGGSAGLMFALTIVDALEPFDVDGRVAGSGSIAPDGAVGPVAEVGPKARAALDDGAAIFLAPKSQAAAAKRAARGLRVIGIETFDDAVRALGRTEGCATRKGAK